MAVFCSITAASSRALKRQAGCGTPSGMASDPPTCTWALRSVVNGRHRALCWPYHHSDKSHALDTTSFYSATTLPRAKERNIHPGLSILCLLWVSLPAAHSGLEQSKPPFISLSFGVIQMIQARLSGI